MPSVAVKYQKLRDKGWTYAEIGKTFGVTRQAVYDACNSDHKGGGKWQLLLRKMKAGESVDMDLTPGELHSLRNAARRSGVLIDIQSKGYTVTLISKGGKE